MIIELSEYQYFDIIRSQVNLDIIKYLEEKYSNQIKINLLNKRNIDYWRFTAQGWVGYIPVSPNFGIRIKPKVPIKNLLGMLEYAYNLKSFNFLDGLINCNTIEEFYNRIASILVTHISDRCRKGLYNKYISKKAKSTYLHGRLDIRETILKPWNSKLIYHYQEQTQDIEENQILLWTLYCIYQNKICHEELRILVRNTYHILAKVVTLKVFTGKDCLLHQYNHLNKDYLFLHSLCRFFIDGYMPSYESGDYKSLPFLVNMSTLYEKFVAEWLKINLPSNFELKTKKIVNLGSINLILDLVIYQKTSRIVNYVLNTKYKCPKKPSTNDLNQIVTYATSQHCHQGIIIYPQKLTKRVNTTIGKININTLFFCLDKDLELAGQEFIKNLLSLEL